MLPASLPRSVRLLSTLALVALPALVAGCGGDVPAAERRARIAADPRAELVVAAAWPWSTRQEFRYGEGLDMAVDEINRNGGIRGRRLRLLRIDDRESVDEGRLVAQRLADSARVVAVIGHLQSYVTVPAAAIYDLGGLVLLAPTSTDPALTQQGYRRVFRGTFTQRAVGAQMADYAASRGYRRVGVYYVRNSYGRGLANAFEERATTAGVTVAARQSHDPTDDVSPRPFAQTLGEWRTAQLDAIFVAGEVPSAGALVAEARRQGLDVPIFGGDALNAESLVRVAGDAAEGTVVASMFHPDEPRPEVRRFAEAFRARHGVPPDAFAALGYDAVQLLADAMRRAGAPTPDNIARALRETRQFVGVTGPFEFDANGDPVDKPVVKLVVRDGRFEYLSAGRPAVAAR